MVPERSAQKDHCGAPHRLDGVEAGSSYFERSPIGVRLISLRMGGKVRGASAEGGVGVSLAAEADPVSDASIGFPAAGPCVQVDALVFSGPQSRSTKMLSRKRPLPSIEMRTPAHWRREVQAQAVN